MSEGADWDTVAAVIRDLRADGYEVEHFESGTSEPTETKRFVLEVSRDA